MALRCPKFHGHIFPHLWLTECGKKTHLRLKCQQALYCGRFIYSERCSPGIPSDGNNICVLCETQLCFVCCCWHSCGCGCREAHCCACVTEPITFLEQTCFSRPLLSLTTFLSSFLATCWYVLFPLEPGETIFIWWAWAESSDVAFAAPHTALWKLRVSLPPGVIINHHIPNLRTGNC